MVLDIIGHVEQRMNHRWEGAGGASQPGSVGWEKLFARHAKEFEGCLD